MRTSPKPLRDRLVTFGRSGVTGAAATLVDLGIIAFAVGVLHVSARAANVPALVAGALVQFLGSRYFAFRAASGSAPKQAALFAAAEGVAMALNGIVYDAVARAIPLGPIGAVVARALTTNAVFVAWSYPVWCRIFRTAEETR